MSTEQQRLELIVSLAVMFPCGIYRGDFGNEGIRFQVMPLPEAERDNAVSDWWLDDLSTREQWYDSPTEAVYQFIRARRLKERAA
jgi:hypothetical protein